MDDPRQTSFTGAIGKIKEKLAIDGYEKVAINNRENLFRASHVDLGWIQDAVQRKYPHELKDEDSIDEFVRSCVQRSKFCRVTITKKEHYDSVVVKFTTKDDMGYYEYGFEVISRE